MAKAEKYKSRKSARRSNDSLEITKHSVKTTGTRATKMVVAATVALGCAYLFVSYGKPAVTASVSGSNGIAIGQARDVTVNNGSNEAK